MSFMKLLSAVVCALGLNVGVAAAATVTYTYVGSWNVSDGPLWSAQDGLGNYTTGVYTGQEAAALIFGGSASDYAISTVSDQVADINFSAWLDGWADPTTYGPNGGNPAAHDFKVDTNGDGLYAIEFGQGNAYSAYVADHVGSMAGAINYAFKISMSEVPVPAALPLLLVGIGGLGLVGRKRRKA